VIRTDEAVLLDYNRLPLVLVPAARLLLRIDRRRCGEDCRVTPDDAVVLDLAFDTVDDRATPVNAHVPLTVAVEWRGDGATER
jgi:hypothetical protein